MGTANTGCPFDWSWFEMEITDNERKWFGELAWNALSTTDPSNWSEYAEVLTMFCHVAPTHILEGRYKEATDLQERLAIRVELDNRAHTHSNECNPGNCAVSHAVEFGAVEELLQPLSWVERANVDSGKEIR
jgi:hypothetical protein